MTTMNGKVPNGHDLGPDYIASKLEEPAGEPPRVPMPEEAAMPAPLFEIIIPSAILGAPPLHHFCLWGDGSLQGFEKVLGADRKIKVINRVPMLLDTVMNPLRGFVREMDQQIEQLAGDKRG